MIQASRQALLVIFALLACGSSLSASAQTKPTTGPKDLDALLPTDAHRLKIGDPAPDFSLKGVDGKTYMLADFKDAPILVVAFLSNHCPYSHAAETRLLPLLAEMKPRGVAAVAINPNSPDAINPSELGYSKYNDSYQEMKLYAKERGFTFPYLYDGDTQTTAKAYGCLCTPHIFIFDQQRKLRYMGRVDDSRFADPATVKSNDARNALEAMLAGKPVPVEVTKPMGCSTKWIGHNEVAQLAKAWSDSPVTLEKIDAAGVAALAKNPTSKVRMINVWATWCAPCTAEFPGLVSIAQRLSTRDFELITISLDDPKDEPKAKAFLDQQHAAVSNRLARSLKAEGRTSNNYLFTGASTDALMQAIDPSAPGPVPYTVIIAPGGKVLYRQAGPVDSTELLSKLIDIMGPYYPQTGR
jgi:peroxiredoxin